MNQLDNIRESLNAGLPPSKRITGPAPSDTREGGRQRFNPAPEGDLVERFAWKFYLWLRHPTRWNDEMMQLVNELRAALPRNDRVPDDTPGMTPTITERLHVALKAVDPFLDDDYLLRFEVADLAAIMGHRLADG